MCPGVPRSGVSSVILNVTATGPETAGWLTRWNGRVPRPTASSLTFVAGQTVPNLVVTGVSQLTGQVAIYNGGGPVDVVVDVAGWFTGG